jgi:signal transduction histidine kinase
MTFFQTFRGRLLLILAALLVATVGVQYYLNLLSQEENAELREEQAQALVAGFAVGAYSLTGDDRVQALVEAPNQTFLDEEAKARIRDILIIDNEWQITDSLSPDYLPNVTDDGTLVYRRLEDLTDLPPLMEGGRLGTDLDHFPNRKIDDRSYDDEAHAMPLETSQGRWYVMVILRNDKGEAAWRAAKPLIGILGLLSASTLITFVLVWRFTRPVVNLSNAARSVAQGSLDVRVPDDIRNDEMGQLAKRFNEMTAQLEKKRDLESQLRQAEQSAVIGRLGSAIAHEIRNPLNYINLTLDHLRARFAPAEAEKRETFTKLTTQLKAEVARINQQITDFLNYSRPAKADIRPIDLRRVIDDSLRIVEAQAAENGVRVSVVEHENVPQTLGDPEFLRSVFNNLFINAVQAIGPAGGQLTVKVTPEGKKYVRIEVADTGPGIAEENLSRIFEPYFSTKETGTGLGLAIVQKIVEGHQGSIAAESDEGQGARFTVKLPAAGGGTESGHE